MVSGLNWEKFLELPGDARTNFEAVARAATLRNYARCGQFAARAQQPGVEFHLTIELPGCELGDPGRKYGWQTKWWDIPGGRNLMRSAGPVWEAQLQQRPAGQHSRKPAPSEAY